jgi:hypothetical protein
MNNKRRRMMIRELLEEIKNTGGIIYNGVPITGAKYEALVYLEYVLQVMLRKTYKLLENNNE